MSSNFNKLYIDGLWIQWAFHRVQEHPKRSSLLNSILILIFQPYIHLFIYIFTIYYSLLSIHYSLLCISLFIITYSLFNIQYYVFTITYLLFIHVEIRRNPVILVPTRSSRCVEYFNSWSEKF